MDVAHTCHTCKLTSACLLFGRRCSGKILAARVCNLAYRVFSEQLVLLSVIECIFVLSCQVSSSSLSYQCLVCRCLTSPNGVSFNLTAACATSTKRELLVLKWLHLHFNCPCGNAIAHQVNSVELFLNCGCSPYMSYMQANKCMLAIWQAMFRKASGSKSVQPCVQGLFGTIGSLICYRMHVCLVLLGFFQFLVF